MRPSFATLAPLILTLSAVAWLLSELMGGPPPEAAKPRFARVDAALLSPKFGALPSRDPFQGLDESPSPSPAPTGPKGMEVAAPAREAAPSPGATVSGVVPGAASSGPGLIQRLSRRVTSALSDLTRWCEEKRREAEARRRLAREVQAEVADQARLSATSLRGRRRMAILNDRTYVEGETIARLGSLQGPVVVSQIRASSVVLRYRGASAVVSFPSIARPSGPGAGRPAPAASRSSGRPSEGRRP